MTDHRKIPVPKQSDDETPGESLFERAAGRFDFSSFASPPIPVSAEAPTRRVPAKPVEAPVAVPVPAPAPASVIPPVAEASAPTPAAAAEPVAEPFFSPAVFTGGHLPVDR